MNPGLLDMMENAAHRHVLAGPEDVLLRHGAREYHPLTAAETCSEQHRSGRAFGYGDIHVDLIGRALYRRRLDVDVGEVAEAVYAAP